LFGQAGRQARGLAVRVTSGVVVAGHAHQMSAHGVEAVVAGSPLVSLELYAVRRRKKKNGRSDKAPRRRPEPDLHSLPR
jgi:hypothetical protein